MEKEIESYLKTKEGLWEESTLYTVRSKLRVLTQLGLDPAVVYERLRFQKKSMYTIKQYLILAMGFERYVKGTENFKSFLDVNAFAFRNAYQEKSEFLTEDDFQEHLAKARKNPRLYNMLILMGRAGLRKSEALNAKWSDIRGNDLTVVGKGGKKRHIPIDRSLLVQPEIVGTEYIAGPSTQYRYFFLHLQHSCHDFRAFYATNLSRIPGFSPKDASRFLGHSSITTTEKYFRHDYNHAKQVFMGVK